MRHPNTQQQRGGCPARTVPSLRGLQLSGIHRLLQKRRRSPLLRLRLPLRQQPASGHPRGHPFETSAQGARKLDTSPLPPPASPPPSAEFLGLILRWVASATHAPSRRLFSAPRCLAMRRSRFGMRCPILNHPERLSSAGLCRHLGQPLPLRVLHWLRRRRAGPGPALLVVLAVRRRCPPPLRRVRSGARPRGGRGLLRGRLQALQGRPAQDRLGQRARCECPACSIPHASFHPLFLCMDHL